MRRLLSRTSITIDEAVAILLAAITDPADFGPIDEVETEDIDRIREELGPFAYDLREDLEDTRGVLEGEYEFAKHEKAPKHVIAEKRAALQRQEALIDRANAYLCAIRDELNKGEQSMLRVDRALSNSAYTFITLQSFKEWVRQTGGGLPQEQAGAAGPAGPSPQETTESKPRIKLLEQEDAILEEIRRQGLDPEALPWEPPGKAGIKAAIRKSLDGSPPFDGSTIFDKAWDRLTKDKREVGRRIVRGSDPRPHKK